MLANNAAISKRYLASVVAAIRDWIGAHYDELVANNNNNLDITGFASSIKYRGETRVWFRVTGFNDKLNDWDVITSLEDPGLIPQRKPKPKKPSRPKRVYQNPHKSSDKDDHHDHQPPSGGASQASVPV